MARLLLLSDPVVPMSKGASPIPRGAVIVDDQVIAAIGTQDDLVRLGPFDMTLGSDKHILIPGLVNGHHHAGRTFRSGVPDAPFERRNLLLHLLVSAGTEDSLYRTTLYSCVELLRAGITSVAVIFYPNTSLPDLGAEAALSAYLDSGMRVAFAVAQRDQSLYVHEDDDQFLRRVPQALAARVRASAIGRYSARSLDNEQYFRQLRSLFQRWHGREERIRIDVGPDWLPSCSDGLLRESRRVAVELGTQIQIHLLETRYEMLMARRRWGESAVEHLLDLGFLGPDVVCAHSVWLTGRDIDLYAKNDVVAVHNPASNLRLFSGIAPVQKMLAQGVTVAFGCDGLAFADDNDLLSDLRLSDLLQRTPGIRSERVSSRTFLEMATVDGARALGLHGRIGELACGRLADLVLLRKDRIVTPYVHPASPIEDLLLTRARAEDVETVLIGGKIVLQAGQTIRINQARLTEQLAEDADRALAAESHDDRALALELEGYVVRLLAGWDWPEPEGGYRYNTR